MNLGDPGGLFLLLRTPTLQVKSWKVSIARTVRLQKVKPRSRRLFFTDLTPSPFPPEKEPRINVQFSGSNPKSFPSPRPTSA